MNERIVDNTGIFPAKILLFGEYGIISGNSGLAVPYTRFGGRLRMEHADSEVDRKFVSGQSIRRLFNFLKMNEPDFSFVDLAQMNYDLEKGLWFD